MKTKKTVLDLGGWTCAAALIGFGGGCGKSDTVSSPSAAPVAKPAEAASQLQQAFVNAPPEVQTTATAASEALRTADYARAVQSLEAIKARSDLTAQQSMAVHESEVALVARLIAAMEAGDPQARKAYEMRARARRD